MKKFWTITLILFVLLTIALLCLVVVQGLVNLIEGETSDSAETTAPVAVTLVVTETQEPLPTPPKQVVRGADITLEVEERDFGTIWDHQSVTTTFPFKNTGSQPLVLTRLQAGCGCTTPVADKTVLQPGESGTITLTFDPRGKANKQDKKVTIFSNSVADPEKAFWIRSFVKPFIEVKNKFLSFGEMVLGEPKSIEFDFFPFDPDFKLKTITGTGKHGQYINAYELDMPESEPRRIRIDVAPTMPWGAFHSQVVVSGTGKMEDGSEVFHTVTVFANGKTFGKIRADQHIISIGTLQPGGAYHKRVRIFRTDGEPFQVLNTTVLQPTVSGMNATAVQTLDGYDIIVTGTLPVSHRGPINAEIMVQTDVPGEEVLRFRATGVVPKR